MVEISGEITLLHELSNTIRKAGRKTQDERALKHFTIKDADGNELEEALEKAFAHNILDRFPACSETIRMRLASSMVLRRKRILYRRRRHANHPIKPAEPVGKPSLRPPPPNPVRGPGDGSSHRLRPREKMPVKDEGAPSLAASTAMKSATTLAMPDFQRAQAPSVVSQARTIALGSHEELVFPPAPRKHIRDRLKPLLAERKKELETLLSSIPDYALYQQHNGTLPVDEATRSKLESQMVELQTEFQYQLRLDRERANQELIEFSCPFCLYTLSSADIRGTHKWRQVFTAVSDLRLT